MLKTKHKNQISALVQRDINHPSVVMWTVAYMSHWDCQHPEAGRYIR